MQLRSWWQLCHEDMGDDAEKRQQEPQSTERREAERRDREGRVGPERLVIVRVDEFLPTHTLYRAVCAREGEQPLEDLLRVWVRDPAL